MVAICLSVVVAVVLASPTLTAQTEPFCGKTRLILVNVERAFLPDGSLDLSDQERLEQERFAASFLEGRTLLDTCRITDVDEVADGKTLLATGRLNDERNPLIWRVVSAPIEAVCAALDCAVPGR